MTYKLLSMFGRPTYALMQLPSSLDYELRLYLPKRVGLEQAVEYIEAAEHIERAFRITGLVQWEMNRSGMCICFSCGEAFRRDIFEAVNAIRKDQKLKPIKE